ncbi:WXG100 family type VII secretion target [Micromonospora sp. NPDC049175]|uniref:WXG100 family type VII secretion target n=1 Tax=unclassified Micromonospora TaxID=2617518 RepID=UPI00370F9FD9
MAETRVTPDQLREIGKKIGALLEDHQSVFNKLAKMEPNAGKFDAATWLEDLFVDRRDGIVEHVKYLQRAFDEINTGLYQIADDYERIDGSNADAVSAFNKDAKKVVGGMGDAEFEPTKVKEQSSYKTGDYGSEVDKSTIDPEKNLIKPFKPGDIEGMDEFLDIKGIGPKDDTNLDLRESPQLKDIDGYPDSRLSEESAEEKPEEEKPEEKKPDEKKPEETPLSTGEHFDPHHEPVGEKYVHNPSNDEDFRGKTYRYYEIDGKHQTGPGGVEIWWTDLQPYYYDGRYYRPYEH